MGGPHVDVQRGRERAQPTLPGQRREAAGQRHRAQHGRRRPRHPGPGEGAPQRAHVEARAVRHQHPAAQATGELGQRPFGRRRGVHHLLRDPGQALHRPRERRARRHQRRPAVVQLAAAHQDRAHLGHLAVLARRAVGLHVHAQELRLRQRAGQELLRRGLHGHGLRARADVLQPRLQNLTRAPRRGVPSGPSPSEGSAR